jgi:hypothetical protein
MSSPSSSASSMWAIIGLWRKSSTGMKVLLSDNYRPKYTQQVGS